MPITLKSIDKIGREKNRDVLYIAFDEKVFPSNKYKDYENRADLLKWLDENNIGYEMCFEYCSPNGFRTYRGQLYIDVPFDETLNKYNLLNNHIEFSDGALRFQGIGLFALPLAIAIKNAYMDEPDYVASWADY